MKIRLAMEVTLVLLFNMMAMWQLGFFELGLSNGATKFGFELQRMDLAQPLNFPGWSVLLSPISIESQGNFDGFNYLGLGSILGLMIAVLITIREKVYFKSLVRSNIGIIISAAIMAAYAITNYVSIARNTFVIPLPEAISIITDTFRGAGRFFWVTIYILCIFQVIMILRLKGKVATFLLVCIAFIQLGDTSIGWAKLREVNRSSYSSIASQVQKGDLGDVMIHTKYLRCFPVYDELPNWKTLGLIAVVYQKQTTCIRASRLNVERVEEVRREFKEAIFSDKLTPDTLYVVPNEFRQYVANSYPKNQIMFFDSMMLLLSKDVAYDKDEKIK